MLPKLSFALGVVPPVLQAWLCMLLAWKGLIRLFPFFFTYTVFAVMAEVGKIWLLQQQASYFYFYFFWATEALYAILGFLAIYEVFHWTFKNFYRLWWFKFLLPVMGALMLTLSILIPVTRPPVQAPLVLAAIFSAEITVRCLQVGMFFLTFLLARLFGLFYRQYLFGIAAGFGISAMGILLTTMVRSGFGTKYKNLLTFAPSVSYDIAVLVWLFSFLRMQAPDPFEGFRDRFTPELFLEHLRHYRNQIKAILKL